MTVAWGHYRVAVASSGYLPVAASVVCVVGGQITTQNLALAPQPKLYLPMIGVRVSFQFAVPVRSQTGAS